MKTKIKEFFDAIKSDQILLLSVIAFSVLTICMFLFNPALTFGVLTGTAITQYATYTFKRKFNKKPEKP